MSTEEEDSGTIHKKTVTELVRAFRNADDGDFTFLIGAGASAPEPAEIPTADKMIQQFQKKIHDEEHIDNDNVDEWADEVETRYEVDDNKRYGFWFEKAYPTPRGRREKIQQLVTKSNPDEAVDPPFGQIILASMMANGIVSHTFTSNFDDLLFDAFYNYSDDRPLFIDHDEKAKRFNMSGDDPAIVKLHGDYLHYTQNTPTETEELKPKIKEKFRQSVSEYGTVVIGYGGADDSIMSVLEQAAFCEGGLFWCEWKDGSGIDDRVRNLLRQSENSYLVKIEGSDDLLRKLWEDIERVQLPDPERIMQRAREHRAMIKRQKNIPEENVTMISEVENDEPSEASQVWDARDLITDEKYEKAIDVLDQVVEDGEARSTAYNIRGIAKKELEKYKDAVQDYDKAIEINPKDGRIYNNRGNTYDLLGKHERAIEDYNKALELNPEDAITYNSRGTSYSKLGNYQRAIEDYNKAIELNPEYGIAYANRAESLIELKEYEQARDSAKDAYELADDTNKVAHSLLLLLISEVVIDEAPEDLKQEYQNICKEEFITDWNFTQLDRWLDQTELNKENEGEIREMISLLKEHT